jgi:class 3 adenylate cyclase/tetratricopeptide (TPR) repeat protein
MLASYVPDMVLQHLATTPPPLASPVAQHFPAAVLFTDITGFTALADRLALRGTAGVEELSRMLNEYFDKLITIINTRGGDIVKFAGDGLIAIWPVTCDGDTGAPTLRLATLQAAQTGLMIQEALHNYHISAEVDFAMRIGIGAGDVTSLHLGGVFDRWEFAIVGAPLTQVGAAEREAQPGQVVLSPEAWALVRDACSGRILNDGCWQIENANVTAAPASHLMPTVLPQIDSMLRAYVPAALLSRLNAGQSDWLAELRWVTVLFVHLPNLGISTSLEQAQTIVRELQMALYHYEGSFVQLAVDDKGLSLVAALGLPPMAHEDDTVRGVGAALLMRERMLMQGLRSSIGVASGRAFCGPIGNDTRRSYSLVGDVMNLAARLMQAAQGDVLCDVTTYEAARGRIAFDALDAIPLKGKAELVAVYRPRARGDKLPGLGVQIMAGRVNERARLRARLDGLLRDYRGGAVVIEGEAGIGKSRLVEDLLQHARTLDVHTLTGAADSIEKSTPYYAWRAVFASLCASEVGCMPDSPSEDVAARREQVLARLAVWPEIIRLAPLLNVVLPLDLPENELTAQMTGMVRADNTQQLLTRLLQTVGVSGGNPLLLVIEDAHWLDSASWALMQQVVSEVQPVLLVIALRPLPEPIPGEYRYLISMPTTEHLKLDVLPRDDIIALVCRRLGVGSLPAAVSDLIWHKAEGHPLFSEELAYALRDARLIAIENGACRVAPNVDLGQVSFPDTVHGVITSRIDRLTPSQQLTLKMASVIGRVFAFRVLHDVHPLESDRPHLGEYLHELERLDLTPLESPEPDLAYIFKHVIIQDVTYNLMLFAQRRQLHRAVARWYERAYASDLSTYYPLLAHHWSKADEPVKTLDYVDKSGLQALRNGAYHEAAEFFTEALQRAPTTTAPLVRARWERQLGESLYGLGRLAESRRHLRSSLKLLGWPEPATPGVMVFGVLRQVILQAMHRLRPRDFLWRLSYGSEQFLEAARAYDRLTEIYYLNNNALSAVHATFTMLNLAELAGPSGELARAYASSCVIADIIPLPALADRYCRLALDTAEAVNKPLPTSWVMLATGLHAMGHCRWPLARQRLARGIEIARQFGDWLRWGEIMMVYTAAHHRHGEFERAAGLAAELLASGRRRSNVLHQAWGLGAQGDALLRLGTLAESVQMLEAACELFPQTADRISEINATGVLVQAYVRSGDLAKARSTAEKTAHLVATARPTSDYVLEGFAGLAELALVDWDGASAENAQKLRRAARKACGAFLKLMRVHSRTRPRAWLCWGRYEWLAGMRAAAIASWQKSLAAAESLDMPYEAALTCFEWGRHSNGKVREQHLAKALQLFERLGCQYDAAQVRAVSGS